MTSDDPNETIQIGETTYYKVRKGNQHYRIVTGKKISDYEFCWRVERDPATKKNYFVNGMDVRKWHLPDIYQTDEERQKEIQLLKERKKKQEEDEAERKRQRIESRRQYEKFELAGPAADSVDAPFLLLRDESENLNKKQKGKGEEHDEQGKKKCCGCVVQ